MGEMISVIVPVYNVAEYLGECIDSILSQTYRELEIILVDDGSMDGSGEICDEYAAKDARVRVIHQKNGGVSSARNAGLDNCSGELISFVDADDWQDLRMYEKLLACLTENQADAAMCGFVNYLHGTPVKKGLFEVPPCDFTGTVYQMMRRNGYLTSPWAKLFRRELIFKKGAPVHFDSAFAFGEDGVWLLEVLRDCSRTAFLPESLYYWRSREGSVTRSETITEKQLSILAADVKYRSLLPDDASVLMLARALAYNTCFILKVQAYCSGNKSAIRVLKNATSSMRFDFLRSSEVKLLKKMKVLLIEFEMLIHMPTAVVNWTNERTH